VPPPKPVTTGAANAGETTTHNNPAHTKLFQDISFSPPTNNELTNQSC
jgi:hypothetical protein